MDWMSMISGLMNSGAGDMGSMGGLMSGMGGQGVGSQSGGMAQPMSAMNPDFAAGMMGGAPTNTGGKTSKYAAPTEAMDRELGMSALNHYKDMSQYANMGSLMGPLGNMQSMSSNAMNKPSAGKAYQNPYLTGLMGF